MREQSPKNSKSYKRLNPGLAGDFSCLPPDIINQAAKELGVDEKTLNKIRWYVSRVNLVGNTMSLERSAHPNGTLPLHETVADPHNNIAEWEQGMMKRGMVYRIRKLLE